MAAAPTKGIEFSINNRKIVFGVLHNGDTNVLVLAVEKGVNSGDYEWWSQRDLDRIDYNVDHRGADINAEVQKFVAESVEESNAILDDLFGKVTEPKTTKERVEAHVLGNVTYNPAEQRLELK